jgi:hypothetical protein
MISLTKSRPAPLRTARGAGADFSGVERMSSLSQRQSILDFGTPMKTRSRETVFIHQ